MLKSVFHELLKYNACQHSSLWSAICFNACVLPGHHDLKLWLSIVRDCWITQTRNISKPLIWVVSTDYKLLFSIVKLKMYGELLQLGVHLYILHI